MVILRNITCTQKGYKLSRILQKDKATNRIDRERDLLWGIGSCTDGGGEAPPSDPPSWRPRTAGGIFPVQAQRPGNQGSRGWKTQSESEGPRTRSIDAQGQEKWMSQLKQTSPSYCFFPSKAFSDGKMPTWINGGTLLHWVYDFQCSSLQRQVHRYTGK